MVAPDLLPVVDPLPDLRIDTADEEEENVAAEMELGGHISTGLDAVIDDCGDIFEVLLEGDRSVDLSSGSIRRDGEPLYRLTAGLIPD